MQLPSSFSRHMRRALGAAPLLLGTLILTSNAGASPPPAAESPQSSEATANGFNVPVRQYQLENGLTVILHEDHSLPIVATEVVYLVGSSHEARGKTGFAHLFEHLMFQGSLHHDSEYFEPFEPIGAEVNGTTSNDRTNYYEHVPRQYAELTLWMESDRMRSLLDVLTLEKLNNQRDVVRNERRQRYEIAPYGMAFWYLGEALFPEGHPYRHSPIGSHEDLSAASLDDVKTFFRKYYAPANAALIVAGDFERSTMEAWIEKYFGDIAAGERAPAPVAPKVVRNGRIHWLVEDQVQLPRVYLAFETPALFQPGDAELDLLSDVLTGGKTSRLYQSLVYERKLAQDVSAFQMSRKLSGVYIVEATLAPGTTLDELGPALEQELEQAITTLPTETEMARAKNAYKKDFFHRVESVGERASLLGSYFVHTGQADYILKDYERYANATPQDVHHAAKKYLDLSRSVRLDFVPGKRGQPPRDLGTTKRAGSAQ